MIENKSQFFFSLRNKPTNSFDFITIDPVKLELEDLSSKVDLLNKKLERNSLPSFDCKISRQREISDLRFQIQNLSNSTEQDINSFEIKNKCLA